MIRSASNARYIAFCVLMTCLSGCGNESTSAEEARLPGQDYVRLDGVEPRLDDDFLAIELSAHTGVNPLALSKALSGNRVIPREIAESFAKKQRKSEARYWLQVGAENGDGVSMQQLSITLKKENCWRARYWLERSLRTTHLPSLSRAAAEQDLVEYRKMCP